MQNSSIDSMRYVPLVCADAANGTFLFFILYFYSVVFIRSTTLRFRILRPETYGIKADMPSKNGRHKRIGSMVG